jgi:outer membrane biosynthesis protein TonB
MLGSLLMAGSAVGMTLVRMLEERSSSPAAAVAAFHLGGPGRSAAERSDYPRDLKRRIRTFRIGGLKVRLDASEARAYELIASGSVAGSELETLLALLPQEVQNVLSIANTTVSAPDPAAVDGAVEPVARDVKRKAKPPKQQEDPEPEPSPEPSPSGEDSGDGGSGQEEDEGEGTGLILNDG